jgi:hypothetical protein
MTKAANAQGRPGDADLIALLNSDTRCNWKAGARLLRRPRARHQTSKSEGAS